MPGRCQETGSWVPVRSEVDEVRSLLAQDDEPIFDLSVALEFVGFAQPDVVEGVRAIREKTAPVFD